MLRNYFKIAWRNLRKNSVFSLINIFGLAVAIAFTLLIGAFIYTEINVNHDLKNADRQYILLSKWKDPNMGFEIGSIAELPVTLQKLYPDLVENHYHWDGVSSNVSMGERHFREDIQVGDSTLLSMYGFGLLQGDPATAFTDPYAAVITQKIAKKYFGKTDVVGKNLTIENFFGSKHEFVITGVLKNIPDNSVTHINGNNNAGIFLPQRAALFLGRNMKGWNNTGLVSYITLKKGITPLELKRPIKSLIERNTPVQIRENLQVELVPLTSYYLDANNGLERKLLYALSGAAFFILLMAIINFINICIGRSASRLKEMGLRKVLGGKRRQLIFQSLTESIILVTVSTFAALFIYSAARPLLNNMLGKEITPLFSFPPGFYLVPIVFSLLVGLLAGLYPAFVLSSLKSVDALKGQLGSVKDNILLRKILVGFQFGTAALVIIIGSIISKQVNFFFNGDLGYNKDYIIYAQVPRDWSAKGVSKLEQIRYTFSGLPFIKAATLSWEVPDGANGGPLQLYRPGTDPKNAIITDGLSTDNHYATTYGIQLEAGQFFSTQASDVDTAKIVVNETAVKALGWPSARQAIGQPVNVVGMGVPLTIAGVTKDFHFGSLKSEMHGLSFIHVKKTTLYRYLSFKMQPGNLQQQIAQLQKKWNEVLPDAPFEYQFMDEGIAGLYSTEIQLKRAANMAAALTMIIVLLGVLGLISLSIQKRTKEIGIRKVLGASPKNIIALFIREFIMVIFIAAIAASPLAYLIMHHWLGGYAYHIKITPYPFILSLSLLAVFTILLISFQTLKTALDNPTNSLKIE